MQEARGKVDNVTKMWNILKKKKPSIKLVEKTSSMWGIKNTLVGISIGSDITEERISESEDVIKAIQKEAKR